MTINFVPLIIIFNFLINNSFNRFIQIPEKKLLFALMNIIIQKDKRKKREAFSKKKKLVQEK